MYLLQYTYQYPTDCIRGPGYSWMMANKNYATREDLLDKLEEIQEQIADARHHWDNSLPRYRERTFVPPVKDIRIFKMVRDPRGGRHPGREPGGYGRRYSELDDDRQRQRKQEEAEERRQLRELAARYPEEVG